MGNLQPDLTTASTAELWRPATTGRGPPVVGPRWWWLVGKPAPFPLRAPGASDQTSLAPNGNNDTGTLPAATPAVHEKSEHGRHRSCASSARPVRVHRSLLQSTEPSHRLGARREGSGISGKLLGRSLNGLPCQRAQSDRDGRTGAAGAREFVEGTKG